LNRSTRATIQDQRSFSASLGRHGWDPRVPYGEPIGEMSACREGKDMNPCTKDQLATATAPHPSWADLVRFIRGESERGEVQVIVRHLLSGCPQCRQRARKLWNLGELRPPDKYLLAEMRRLVWASLEGWVSFEGEEPL
jgi:hypothetical protein